MEQLPQQLLPPPPPPQTANAQAANGNVEPVQLVRQLIAATQAAYVVALRLEPDPTYKNNVKRFKELSTQDARPVSFLQVKFMLLGTTWIFILQHMSQEKERLHMTQQEELCPHCKTIRPTTSTWMGPSL